MRNPFGITERKCRKTDYDFVYSLTKKSIFPHIRDHVDIKEEGRYIRKRLRKSLPQIRILMKGKRRIGYYQIWTKKDYLHVSRIFLSPAYQRKGIGTFFMKYFESLGHRKIELSVWAANPAVNFYKKLGYKIIERKDHRCMMEKKL